MAENKGKVHSREEQEQGLGIGTSMLCLGASKRQWLDRVCADRLCHGQLREDLSEVLFAVAFIWVVKISKSCIFIMDRVTVTGIMKVLSLLNVFAVYQDVVSHVKRRSPEAFYSAVEPKGLGS